MADWDPFAIDEAPTGGYQAPTPAAADAGADGEAEIDIPEKMVPQILSELAERFNKLENKPWLDFKKTATPDLSLYTPTCGIEDWKHKDVDLVIGKGIAYIILNRPDEDNSITDSVNAAYCDAVHALHSRSDIRVVVLTARGKMFSSGIDPKWDGVPTQPRSAEAMKAADNFVARSMKMGLFESKEQATMVPFTKAPFNFCQLPQLTVAILNGSVMGQGISLVCSCDVVISVKSAYFSLSDVKMGLVPAVMVPYICLKTSNNLAKKMLMLGENFDAETARQRGFVNYIVDDLSEANNVLKEVCGRMKELSPEQVTQSKKLAYAISGRPVTREVLWYSVKSLNESLTSDFKKGEQKPWADVAIEPIEPAPFA